MVYDTKLAVIIRTDLAQWQKLSVACFLAGGIAGDSPELAGEPYTDADGRTYGSLVRHGDHGCRDRGRPIDRDGGDGGTGTRAVRPRA